jgi:hypothetical protein
LVKGGVYFHLNEHKSLVGDPGRKTPLEGRGFRVELLWNRCNSARKY